MNIFKTREGQQLHTIDVNFKKKLTNGVKDTIILSNGGRTNAHEKTKIVSGNCERNGKK